MQIVCSVFTWNMFRMSVMRRKTMLLSMWKARISENQMIPMPRKSHIVSIFSDWLTPLFRELGEKG